MNVATTNDQDQGQRQDHRSGLHTSARRPSLARLFGIGAVLGMAGAVLSGSALVAAIRRRLRRMEVPPRELARQKWARTKTATIAGVHAWNDGSKTKADQVADTTPSG